MNTTYAPERSLGHSSLGGALKFYLIVAKGKHRGRPIPIQVDLFVIGSAKTCQLRAQHSDIGEQHCAVVTRGRKVYVRDLNSGLTTLVNGQPVPGSDEWPLHRGDVLRVGPLEFRVSIQEKSLSQQDLEEWALMTLDEASVTRTPQPGADFDDSMRVLSRELTAASSAAAAILNQAQEMNGEVHGQLRITREGSLTIVRINEPHLVDEAELSHLKRELQQHLQGNTRKVLLDLKNVRRMSSVAVSLFADLNQWLKPKGGSLAVCRLRPELAGLVSDLRNLFNIRVYDDQDKAVAAKW